LFKSGFDKYILKHAQKCKAEHYEADLIPKENPKWVQENAHGMNPRMPMIL